MRFQTVTHCKANSHWSVTGGAFNRKTMQAHAPQTIERKNTMIRNRRQKIKHQPPPPQPRKCSPAPPTGRSFGWQSGLLEAAKRLKGGVRQNKSTQ
jgi:hypothetical protein